MMGSLSDCNWTRTHNHLVRKRTLRKKKTDPIEMIVYGYMNGKLRKVKVEDISINKAHKILSDKNINIKSLPGYGNLGLRKKI